MKGDVNQGKKVITTQNMYKGNANLPTVGLLLYLQQTNLLPLQTGQKVEYWQDKSTAFSYCAFFLAIFYV